MPTDNEEFQRLDMNECVSTQLRARGVRADAGETAVFVRELDYLQAGAVEAKFPEFVGAALVPIVGNAIPAGAKSHTYRELTGYGEAELLENMTPEDFPTVDVTGAEQTGKFRSFGAKYHVSLEHLRAKPSLSVDIEDQKGKLARKVMESKLDRLIFTGAPGIFTGIASDAFSQDDTSADDWETGNADNDIAAVRATFERVIGNQFLATSGLFPDLDFIVSSKMWLKMNKFLPASMVGGVGTTLASFLLREVRGVRSITHAARLNGAGASGKDRLLAFPRDPEVLDALVPIRFSQTAPQLNGMVFTTYCEGKYGGIRVRHPKAIRRVDVTVT